ncbi:MAG TPA: hypothetical protein VFB72_17505, partial [Verrucomicrobiae bacterium]|nr:hypothetical protein [Verrucomicrobiae bacterium]
ACLPFFYVSAPGKRSLKPLSSPSTPLVNTPIISARGATTAQAPMTAIILSRRTPLTAWAAAAV